MSPKLPTTKRANRGQGQWSPRNRGRTWEPYLAWETLETEAREAAAAKAREEGRHLTDQKETRRFRVTFSLLLLLIGAIAFDLGVTLRTAKDREAIELAACGLLPPIMTVSRRRSQAPPALPE